MGKRSRKKRARPARRPGPARPDPPARPPAPGPSPASGAARRGARAWIGIAVAAAAIVAVGLAIVLLLRRESSPEISPGPSGPPPRPQLREAPPLEFARPADLHIPDSFPHARRALAESALEAHARALEAHARKDTATFLSRAREAFDLYRKADWLLPELDGFHVAYISSAFEAGRVKLALDEGEDWLRRFPGRSPRHDEALGKFHYLMGQYAAAARRFQAFAERYPGSLLTQRRLAQVYASLGDKEGALRSVDRCLDLIGFTPGSYPAQPQAPDTLAVCLQVTHRFYEYRRLEQIASVILGKHPRNAEALMALGVAERYLGKYEKAREHLRAFLRGAPRDSLNSQLIRLDLAIVLLKTNRPREAISELVTLLMENPHLPKAYFHLGQALVRLGRQELADRMYERSRVLGPVARELRREKELRAAGHPVLADRALALAHRIDGEYRQAEAVFRSVLKRNPRATAYRVYLIEHLVETRQIAAARREIDKLEEQLGESHPDVQSWTAKILALEGNFEDAVRRLEAVCKREEQLRVWGLELSRWLLDDLGRPGRARAWLEAFLELGPDPTARILLARAAFAEGEIDEAVALLSGLSGDSDEWRREFAGICYARCRIRKSMDLEAIGGELARAGPLADPRPEYHLAMAEWLEAGGDPRILEADTSATAPALAVQERARAAELQELRAAVVKATRRAAATENAETAAAHLLEAARLHHRMKDRGAALRLAGYAAYARPGDLQALELLHDWYDRPEEIFLRAGVARRLHSLNPGFPEPSGEEILGVLLEG